MELTDVASDNEQMAAGLEMMKGASTSYIFNQSQMVAKMNMMGGMMKTSVHAENEGENITMLFDMMGNKMLIETSKTEMEASQAENDTPEFNIVYDENDTKEILGYKCKKATLTPKGEGIEGMEMILYISNDIKANSQMIQGLNTVELDGFPLEYQMKMPEMSMTYTTTELKKEVDADAFKMNKAGYTKMTWEEFQESMGAMGGGMGF